MSESLKAGRLKPNDTLMILNRAASLNFQMAFGEFKYSKLYTLIVQGGYALTEDVRCMGRLLAPIG